MEPTNAEPGTSKSYSNPTEDLIDIKTPEKSSEGSSLDDLNNDLPSETPQLVRRRGRPRGSRSRGTTHFTHYKARSRGGKKYTPPGEAISALEHRAESTEPMQPNQIDESLAASLEDVPSSSPQGDSILQAEVPTPTSQLSESLVSNSPASLDLSHTSEPQTPLPLLQDVLEDDTTITNIEVNHPDISLVEEVVLQLQRTLPFHFICFQEQDGINVMLVSRDRERCVQRRVFFSFNGGEEITVHCRAPPLEVRKDILNHDENEAGVMLTDGTKVEFVQRICAVVEKLKTYEVCVGVDDKEYERLWAIDSHGEVDKNPYREQRYDKTFRPFSCYLLVPTEDRMMRRCAACTQIKRQFRVKLQRHSSADVKPSTANVHLDRDQMVWKLEKQQKDLQYQRAQNKRLKEELAKALSRNGTSVDNELSDDLSSILGKANLPPIQELFCREQIKLASVKGGSGRRWHPTLVRFALLIKSTSSAAYRAIQDSGVIVLPSERTLYEYSNYVTPKAGVTKEKLNRICKLLSDKYPADYQKYHMLQMDEIHINQKLVYSKSTGEMIGYCNLSETEKELMQLEAELKGESAPDSPPLATKMLSFLVKGVASAVAEVVASYETSDCFSSDLLNERVWEVIGACENSGIKVIGVVGDGAPLNRLFFESHFPVTILPSGVVFDTVNLCAPERRLFFFSDVPHLLKTTRNCYYKSGSGPSYKRLLTKNGQVIVWQTIRKLFEADKTCTLRRCFKLNSYNVNLNSYSVMRVNYAEDVMSWEVALDLESRNWPGTSETVKFIKNVNSFYEMMNGCFSTQGLRKANPNLEPYKSKDDKRFYKLLDFLKYFEDWKDEVEAKQGFTKKEKSKMLISHQTVKGIEMTIHSFIEATRFLLSEGVQFINAAVFNQNRIEKYFGKQRQSGGGSRNPTAARFFANDQKISLHGDMNVRRSNVFGRKREMEVTDEPLPKRAKHSQQ